MADAWNFRHFGDFPDNTVVRKTGNVNQDLVENLRRKLSVQSKLLSRNPLWHEMSTMKAVIYKHHNQHRKEKYFKGAKRVHNHLKRLQEMDLEKVLISYMNTLPKKNTPITSITRYPCYQAVEYVLLRLMGASKLATQAINHCKITFHLVCSQLSQGFFVTFHLVVATAVSRVWVLLKDLIHNFIDCYEEVYPWMNIVRQNSSEGKEDIPPCLKTWLNADIDEQPPTIDTVNNNNNKSVFTPKTSSLLDKMFLFTPQSGKPGNESVSFQSEHKSLEGYQDSPKNIVKESVIVPRSMFLEQLELSNVSQESSRKRKYEELAPECKTPCLDSNEVRVDPTNQLKDRTVSITHDDKTSKMESSNANSDDNSMSSSQDNLNDIKRKRKLDYFAQDIAVKNDNDEVPKKRHKKKKKKANVDEVDLRQEAVDIDESATAELNPKQKNKKEYGDEIRSNSDDEVIIMSEDKVKSTKKLKKSKKKLKKETEKRQSQTLDLIHEMNSESCESNEEKSQKKAKKKKKKKQETNATGFQNSAKTLDLVCDINVQSNHFTDDETFKKKAEKSKEKKKKKEKLEINADSENEGEIEKSAKKSKKETESSVQVTQHETNDLENTQTMNSTKTKKKKKSKDKVNKSKKSSLELLVVEQDSLEGIEKKPFGKSTAKNININKDNFDELFGALGV